MTSYILFYLPGCPACEVVKHIIASRDIRDRYKYINARTYTGSHKLHVLPVIVCLKSGKEYIGEHAVVFAGVC